MPYSKDIRCGQGWFEANINCFFDFMDSMDDEIVVKTEGFHPVQVARHNKILEEEIEDRVNEYICWKVFNEKRNKLDENDTLPEECDSVWCYVYHHIVNLVNRKPTWYSIRGTLASEEEE